MKCLCIFNEPKSGRLGSITQARLSLRYASAPQTLGYSLGGITRPWALRGMYEAAGAKRCWASTHCYGAGCSVLFSSIQAASAR